MRLLFCGTPEFAVPSLRALLSDPRFHVAGVITQPDRPRGRGLESGQSAVKQVAAVAGVEVFQPLKIRAPEAREWIARKAPEAVVLIAYGQIVPAALLSFPRLGWINLHASLLPKYRGAAPIAWAIANGEIRTGLTTMQIDAGMDTGAVLLRRQLEIAAGETAPELSTRLAQAGAPLVIETLLGLERGALIPQPQDHAQATYAPLLKREDGRISWASSANRIFNRMRAFAPWPGAYAQFSDARVQLWGRPWTPAQAGAPAPAPPGVILVADGLLLVACGEATWLQVTDVQPEGRRRVTAREFVSGARLTNGERFE